MGSSRERETPHPLTKAALEAWAESGRPCRIATSGRSMVPLLRDGCQVVLGPRSDGIGYGDVVVYFLDETLIVHRIVRIKQNPGGRVFLTKGDSSLFLDPRPVSESEIVGRVVAVRTGKRTIDLRSRIWRAGGCLVAFGSCCVGLVGSWMKGWLRRNPPS